MRRKDLCKNRNMDKSLNRKNYAISLKELCSWILFSKIFAFDDFRNVDPEEKPRCAIIEDKLVISVQSQSVSLQNNSWYISSPNVFFTSDQTVMFPSQCERRRYLKEMGVYMPSQTLTWTTRDSKFGFWGRLPDLLSLRTLLDISAWRPLAKCWVLCKAPLPLFPDCRVRGDLLEEIYSTCSCLQLWHVVPQRWKTPTEQTENGLQWKSSSASSSAFGVRRWPPAGL